MKDLGDPMAPKLDAPVTPLYQGHTAAYDPLGVVNGMLYLRTDRDAPNKKIVAVPIDRPDPANWKTIVPEATNSIESASLVAGQVAVNALMDVASVIAFLRSRRHSQRRQSRLQDSARWQARAAASIARRSSTRSLAALSGHRVSTLRQLRRPPVRSTAFEPAEAHLRSVAIRDRARVRHVEGRHARADVHHARRKV